MGNQEPISESVKLRPEQALHVTPPSAHLPELENTVIHFSNICEPLEVQGWVLEIQ